MFNNNLMQTKKDLEKIIAQLVITESKDQIRLKFLNRKLRFINCLQKNPRDRSVKKQKQIAITIKSFIEDVLSEDFVKTEVCSKLYIELQMRKKEKDDICELCEEFLNHSTLYGGK